MKDYRTRSTDEMIAAIDGWTDKDEATNHAKWLAHEVRKLRVEITEARAKAFEEAAKAMAENRDFRMEFGRTAAAQAVRIVRARAKEAPRAQD